MRGNHFEHHGKHDGKDKPRADPLHRAPDERHGKRGGGSAHNCADEEGTQREHSELSRRKPLHEQARKRQNHADHKHVTHHKPLCDGNVDAECHRQLRQGDIERGLAVHSSKAAAEKPHEGKIRVRHLNTGAGKVCIARSHYLNCSFLRVDTRQNPRQHKKSGRNMLVATTSA